MHFATISTLPHTSVPLPLLDSILAGLAARPDPADAQGREGDQDTSRTLTLCKGNRDHAPGDRPICDRVMCLLSDVVGGTLRGSRYLDIRRGTCADFRFYSFHVQ